MICLRLAANNGIYRSKQAEQWYLSVKNKPEIGEALVFTLHLYFGREKSKISQHIQ